MKSIINVLGIAFVSVSMVACFENEKKDSPDGPAAPPACFSEAELAAMPQVKVHVESISRIQDVEDENVARFDIDSQIELNGELIQVNANLLVPGNEEITTETPAAGDYKVVTTVRCAGLLCEDVFLKYDIMATKDTGCAASEVVQLGVLAQQDSQRQILSTVGNYYTAKKAGEFRTMDETVSFLSALRANPELDYGH